MKLLIETFVAMAALFMLTPRAEKSSPHQIDPTEPKRAKRNRQGATLADLDQVGTFGM